MSEPKPWLHQAVFLVLSQVIVVLIDRLEYNQIMEKIIKRLGKLFQRSHSLRADELLSQEELKEKVEKGATKAIKEYKETFRILADYDRS